MFGTYVRPIVARTGAALDEPPPAEEGTSIVDARTSSVSPDLRCIFATTSTNPDWAALKPSAPPAAFTNNHLGYALTWFGLAAALIAFYVVLLRRRMTRKDTES